MKHCTTDKCPQILDSSCVFYEGPSLIFSGVNTNDSVETVIQKLNLKLESIPRINLDNYYTKTEVNTLINNIDLSNYYTKNETYPKTEVDALFTQTYSYINGSIADYNNTIQTQFGNYYTKIEINSQLLNYYNKTELDTNLATKLDKGTYTGTAQDLKNEIDSKQKLLSSFDESILIETDGNIEGNISLFEEYFEQQECELNFIPIQIVGVYVNGIKQKPSLYTITLPKTISVTNFTSGDYIEIQYTKLKI